MGTTRHKPAVWKHITGATPNATLHAGSLTMWMPSAEQAGQTPPHCLSLTANNPTANVRQAAPPSITPPTPPSVAYDALQAPPKNRLPPAAKTPPPYTKTCPTPRPRTSTMASGVEKVQVQGSGKAKQTVAPSPKAKPIRFSTQAQSRGQRMQDLYSHVPVMVPPPDSTIRARQQGRGG